METIISKSEMREMYQTVNNVSKGGTFSRVPYEEVTTQHLVKFANALMECARERGQRGIVIKLAGETGSERVVPRNVKCWIEGKSLLVRDYRHYNLYNLNLPSERYAPCEYESFGEERLIAYDDIDETLAVEVFKTIGGTMGSRMTNRQIDKYGTALMRASFRVAPATRRSGSLYPEKGLDTKG